MAVTGNLVALSDISVCAITASDANNGFLGVPDRAS